MWNEPHYSYAVAPAPDLSILDRLELMVPGALIYGLVNGRRRRLGRMDIDERRLITGYEVLAPVNAAWLVEGRLSGAGVSYTGRAVGGNGIGFWQDDEDSRSGLEAQGRRIVDELVRSGTVRPHVPALLTPYQAMGVAWSQSRPWSMFVYACGSGKTLTGILSALSTPGPSLVVCPAKARHVWWSQVREYTTILPFRMRPESERRKGERTLDQYLRVVEHPFVIAGAESLPDRTDEVASISPSVLILDEIHTHGSSKRWRAIQQADGTVSFEKRKTAASERQDSSTDRVARAVAAMDVSRLTGLRRRIGLTATPLDDGRPRRLWSQLDLLNPGGFAFSYSKFAARYCDAKPGSFGGLDDKGSSNLDELKARCKFLVHEVPYSESHAALPSTRVQVVYLGRTELNRAERWSNEQTFGQAFRGLAREARENPLARERMIEARLSEACSRKRRYVIDEVIEGLRGGGKVVVFTARRRETEVWAEAIAAALGKGDSAMSGVPVWMSHGGVSERERDITVDTFRESKGPCCLVATGQSTGTGVDGLQTASLAVFAMLPWKPGDFIQWKGRFDRLGGAATLLKVVVAEGTYDERVIEILVDKFGPIEQMLVADELKGLDEKLHGLEDTESLIESIVAKLGEGE